ncbi:hypothetical protein Q8A73_012624 [Channa argus]|nr:hypothetical protein Q8A73_012624 [Channa argus]
MSVLSSSNPASGGSEEGCIYSTTSNLILTTLFVTYIVFLPPLFVLLLFVGYQRWGKQRSAGMNSHSDVFTYNMFTLELIGPGEVGGIRERVDQSKKRAFYTIMAIMGALFSRFLTLLVYNVLSVSPVYNYIDYCLAMPASSWSSLPSSLLPMQTDMSVNPLNISSLFTAGGNCFTVRTTLFILTGFLVTYLFLLPLFILILFVGYQRWRKQRSGSPAVMNSHSDIFTYNMVTLELISICGTCLNCYAAYNNVPDIMMVGMWIVAIISPAQNLFHILTCVDRYLAVVQPVTYLRLKQTGGVRDQEKQAGTGRGLINQSRGRFTPYWP